MFSNLEVLEYNTCPCEKKLGYLRVRYHQLVIKCDLVFYKPLKKIWIRMPELWYTQKDKTSFCYWPTKELSNLFQSEVIKQLVDKFGMTPEKICGLMPQTVRNVKVG